MSNRKLINHFIFGVLAPFTFFIIEINFKVLRNSFYEFLPSKSFELLALLVPLINCSLILLTLISYRNEKVNKVFSFFHSISLGISSYFCIVLSPIVLVSFFTTPLLVVTFSFPQLFMNILVHFSYLTFISTVILGQENRYKKPLYIKSKGIILTYLLLVLADVPSIVNQIELKKYLTSNTSEQFQAKNRITSFGNKRRMIHECQPNGNRKIIGPLFLFYKDVEQLVLESETSFDKLLFSEIYHNIYESSNLTLIGSQTKLLKR